MKFKEFVKNCNQLLKDIPESSEFDVIYSTDEEGNSFYGVYYTPTIGVFDDYIFDNGEEYIGKENAVCIN